jgi:hypothetical protein
MFGQSLLSMGQYHYSVVHIRLLQLESICLFMVEIMGWGSIWTTFMYWTQVIYLWLSLTLLEDLTFSIPKAVGRRPPPRGWHSVTAIGKKLYFFGGCNESRKDALFNDMWVLNTETNPMVWEVLEVFSRSPPPRYSHTATAVGSGTYTHIDSHLIHQKLWCWAESTRMVAW